MVTRHGTEQAESVCQILREQAKQGPNMLGKHIVEVCSEIQSVTHSGEDLNPAFKRLRHGTQDRVAD